MFFRTVTAVLAMLAVTLASAFIPPTAHAASPAPTALTFPLGATSATEGVFNGSLRITSFGVRDGVLVASGLVTGTLVDETGAVRAIARSVTLPVDTGAVARKGIVAKQLACEILHLELGPLDLDLLGLVVHLDQVVLDISAVPGAGNLLGNLLCAVTGLLDGLGLLSQIAALLNQILGLLG